MLSQGLEDKCLNSKHQTNQMQCICMAVKFSGSYMLLNIIEIENNWKEKLDLKSESSDK